MIFAVSVLALAGVKMKQTTVSGTLVDLKCYAAMGVTTNDHGDMKKCGSMCAEGGLPLGLVDKKGNVVLLGVPSPAYSKLVGKELRLTGTYGKYSKVFIPKSMEIKVDGKWKKTKLPKTMMYIACAQSPKRTADLAVLFLFLLRHAGNTTTLAGFQSLPALNNRHIPAQSLPDPTSSETMFFQPRRTRRPPGSPLPLWAHGICIM